VGVWEGVGENVGVGVSVEVGESVGELGSGGVAVGIWVSVKVTMVEGSEVAVTPAEIELCSC
jgi:hypothetical protein